MRTSLYLGLFPALLDAAYGANIFVSHYSGTVSSLTLTATSSGGYTLAANKSVSIGGQPSWLTWDSTSRTLYVSDEGNSGTTVTAVSAAANGGMTQLGKSPATAGAVANCQYGGGKYLASVHYGTSTVSTHKLPLGSAALQTMKLTMSAKGPNSRQDAPHPHHAVEDPTGKFVLVPDLGADLVRIYSIDSSSGKLTACDSYVSPAGSGPRHLTFWGKNIVYVGNELANSVSALTVTYPASGCLTLTRFQTLTTMAGNKAAPKGTKVGEVHVKDNFLYVSNRRDLSFSPNDSIASFSLDSAGTMTFQQLTSSSGTYPRTFQINKAGDLVVIGDQTTANVVVVNRDVSTGLLGAQVASMRIGVTGNAENDDGLSAVMWDE